MSRERITAVGETAALLLSKEVLDKLGITIGDEVELSLIDRTLMLQPLDEAARGQQLEAITQTVFARRQSARPNWRGDQNRGGYPAVPPYTRSTRSSCAGHRGDLEAWGLPEEIPRHLPHLTLAQVFDGFSYYSDHQAEIDTYITRNRIPDTLIDPLVTDL